MEVQKSPLKPGFYYGYVIVAAGTFCMIVALGVHYSFGVFLKPLLSEFGWSRAITSGAVSLSWVIQGVSGIIMGRLNDRLGPRKVLTICGIIQGLGFILTSQVQELWQLYLFYGVLVGGGLGGIYVPMTSTVARWFSARRGTMTGIVVAGIGIGTFIVPLAANALMAAYNWRIAYLVLGVAVLVVIVTAAQFLKPQPSQQEDIHKKDTEVLKAHTGGMLFGEAVRTFQFWMVFGLFLCFGINTYIVLVHIVAHTTDIGITPTIAAGILSAIGAVSIAGKIIFGNIGDRIGSRNVYVICFIIMIVSFFWLLPSRSIWMLFLFSVVFGLAYAGCAVSQAPIIASLFGLKSHGLILGLVNFGFSAGATIGPFMAGYIFDVTGSYNLAFLISAAIALAGLVFTLAIKPFKKASA